MKKSAKKIKVPFYAHLLTRQEQQQATAGKSDPTAPRNDLVMTDRTADIQSMKWPSDQEEGGGGV